MLAPDKRNRRSWTIRKPLGIGLAALAGLFGLVFGWAATFNISGAVIGKVEPSIQRRVAARPACGDIVVEAVGDAEADHQLFRRRDGGVGG